MKKLLTTLLASCMLISATAQSVTTASSSMTASPWAQQVPFNIADEGQQFNFATGMGGWSDIQFAYKQRNWVGKHAKVARLNFFGRNNTSGVMATELSEEQLRTGIDFTFPDGKADHHNGIDTDLAIIAPSGVKDILLLCDMDMRVRLSASDWNNTNRVNYYVNDIALAVQYLESKGYNVISAAPFNEPDFNAIGNCGGTASVFNKVAAAMQKHPTLKGRVCGPNTLNTNEAVTWYATVKNNVNYINTHQLAGSFEHLVEFWDTGIAAGKQAVADEMHNVMEAMVVMNHGGHYGTWWGYDGVARAEFARVTSAGRQLAYEEDAPSLTVAGVYRYDGDAGMDANRVKAIIGTSERQALAKSYTFVSQDRLAYYDGYGPTHDYTQDVPGGVSGSYQNGQTNAERVLNVYTGEDVPVEPVDGLYKIVNKKSGKVLSTRGGGLSNAVRIAQYGEGVVGNQEWSVRPVHLTVGGDYSYHFITNSNTSSNTYYLDDLDWSLDERQEVIAYPGGGSGCEQWHLRYVGDGYYTIINRHSGLCLEVLDGNTADGAGIVQMMVDESDAQLWKFVPAEHAVDATAPITPTGLTATPQSGAVKLTWAANVDEDIYGYMVYRYNTTVGIWECIGRKVQGTAFLDNTCRKMQPQRYRIRALDKAYNLSDPSAEVQAQTTTIKALVGHWLGLSLIDNSENMMSSVQYGGVSYTTHNSHPAISFDGTNDYMQLPYYAADMPEMTFAVWVRSTRSTAGQRIFDFGNGEDEYLFLSPTDGSSMRFEIKKDGVTQGLNATTKLGTSTWKHVAVTIGKEEVAIYINGEKDASTSDITLRPSDIAPIRNYIGRSQFTSNPVFKGMISNMRLYNYALSDDEVKALASSALTSEDAEILTRNTLDEAKLLLNQPMYIVVANTLRDAVKKAEDAFENYSTKQADGTITSEDIKAWEDALAGITKTNVVPNAKASIATYKTLASQMDVARDKVISYPREYGNENFAEEIAVVETNYYNGSYPDSEIPAAVIEVKGITNRYLMADAIIFATKDNPIDVSAFIVEQAGFDNDIYAPWQTSPSPGVSYGSVEFWNTNFTFSQLLYGMPPGTYRLQTRAFYRYGDQPTNYTAHHNGTLQRNAKLYISHSEGTQTADIMAISDDPSDVHEWGNWYCDQDGKWVPDNMQAASEAIDVRGKYQPQNGYNSVEITVNEVGDLTIGAKKETLVGSDWTFFGDFSLYYLGGAKRSIKLDEEASALPRINESIEYDEVTLKRTLKAGVWNTFVSPFAIPANMLGGWEVKELTHSAFNGEVLSLTFDEVTDGIQAGVPYMVRNKEITEDLTEFTMTGVQLCATLQNVTTPEGDVTFTGVYHYGPMPEGAFFISNNTFYQIPRDGDDTNNNQSKAFRAYLMPQGAAAEARALSYRTDGVVDEDDNGTSVDSATGGVTVVAIYNTQGERLTDLQDGINILQMSDGTTMKVVIR